MPRLRVEILSHAPASRFARGLACGLMGVCLVCVSMSCGGKTGTPTTATQPPAGELSSELSRLINEIEIRYASLEHEYDEDLLATIDKAEAYLSGRLKGPAPRAIPKLTEQEEYDHLRETIRRWQARTGKDLRAGIDRLKAEVAARKPGGPRYYPDFHKRFAAVFDSFIPIEVAEMRERRNQVIHQEAKPLLEKYRATAPDLVKRYEATLNAPPYNVPPQSPPEPTPKTSPPPKA
jgi:hypothetical protein